MKYSCVSEKKRAPAGADSSGGSIAAPGTLRTQEWWMWSLAQKMSVASPVDPARHGLDGRVLGQRESEARWEFAPSAGISHVWWYVGIPISCHVWVGRPGPRRLGLSWALISGHRAKGNGGFGVEDLVVDHDTDVHGGWAVKVSDRLPPTHGTRVAAVARSGCHGLIRCRRSFQPRRRSRSRYRYRRSWSQGSKRG